MRMPDPDVIDEARTASETDPESPMSAKRPDEQFALDFEVPAPVSADERIAREEIERFYTDRVATAREAYEKAAADLADAQRLHGAWREQGEIVSTFPETCHRGQEQTVMEIVGHAQGRYSKAARTVLRPALEAPTTAAAMVELRRLDTRPETPALRETAEELRDRYRALCRWLITQGHDFGPLVELLDENDRRLSRRR